MDRSATITRRRAPSAWLLCAVAVACGAPAAARANAAPQDVAQLGARLTPFGAEAAGNASGSIPPWIGGLTAVPPCFADSHGRYCDPYADDAPLFVVTAENVAQYADLLSAGQRALLARYPDSFRMRVFPTRRSFANPPAVYAASVANAARAFLDEGTLRDAATGVPFPLPANGAEAMWNHRLRWRPLVSERLATQFVVAASGEKTPTLIRERIRFPYGADGYDLKSARGVLTRLMRWVEQPASLAGVGMLIDDVARPADLARHAWQFGSGAEHVERVPNLGYETAAIASDDLASNDQLDTFFGPLDRYDLKLIGKQELLVPANSYALHDETVSYGDLVGPRHLNPEKTRYERRRVWVVDAVVARGRIHPYRHRRFYLDEDGWQIRIVDVYDADDEPWRVQEAHTVMAYDRQYELPVAQTVYDLKDSRYLVQSLNNEGAEVSYPELDAADFDASELARRGRKLNRAAQR
ncbi:DUF1329 domain-containing protein [Solimonas soli]|uniref:DUF1329 domain-containing protein n=1 Tax=Solimonas soli TaxID=413479 RepID=UPI0004BCB142|nr:DUF1329 domain-containing protein [Solimonas soli]